MSKRQIWMVSVMIGYGRSAQYLMTEPMTHDEAITLAEELVMDCEDNRWVKIGMTYINPSTVTSIRIVKERPDRERPDIDCEEY